MPSIGINIRSTKNRRYALEIANGKKTLETRASDSLKCYIGARVGLIETGNGIACLVGYATVGEPVSIPYDDFDNHYAAHLVTPDDSFYPVPGSVKYCYPMIDPTTCAHRLIKTRGIKARKI